ncbi:MAG: hypothetical protein ACI97A_002595 [Planctomycetota bacterium]|jgi:hypothetical protein
MRSDSMIRNEERGSSLVMAIAGFSMVTAMFVLMFSTVRAEGVLIELDVSRSQALRYSEGLVEFAENGLIDATASFKKLPPPPVGDPFLGMSGEDTVGNVTGTWTVRRISENGIASPAINSTDPDTGLKSVLEPWVIQGVTRFRGSKVTVTKQIMLKKTPIFQFLAFYDADLEINPGPRMNLNGRIHSNADIYMTAGNSLTVESNYFRSAGKINRRRKDSDANPDGDVRIRNMETGELVLLPSQSDLDSLGIPSESGMDSNFLGHDINGDDEYLDPGEMAPFTLEALDLFGGSMLTGEHGVSPVGHPSIQSIQSFDQAGPGADGSYVPDGSGGYSEVAPGTGTHNKGYYNERAELVVIDNQVYGSRGENITNDMPSGFLEEESFYDAREGQTIKVTVIDMALLGDMDGDSSTFDPSPFYPSNGLMFATRSDNEPGMANGIVLTNGSEINIPSKWDANEYLPGGLHEGELKPAKARTLEEHEIQGITVVSPTPVFVKGDFNTQNKKSCSVITDAVSLLSNNWDFSKSKSSGLPSASSTKYNLAFITGNQVTSHGSYNGGFENLPRFHENWSSQTCKIRGSFVNTWRSSIATGSWFYGGNNYKAPRRDWGFDEDLDLELPPYTPIVVDTVNMGTMING